MSSLNIWELINLLRVNQLVAEWRLTSTLIWSQSLCSFPSVTPKSVIMWSLSASNILTFLTLPCTYRNLHFPSLTTSPHPPSKITTNLASDTIYYFNTYEIGHYVFFYAWIILCNIMFVRFNHIVVCTCNFLILLALYSIPFCENTMIYISFAYE